MPEIGTIKESSQSQIGGGCLKSHKKTRLSKKSLLSRNTTTAKKNCNAKSEGGSQKKDTHFALVKTWLEKMLFGS